MDESKLILLLLSIIWIVPIYAYLLVWSVKIRIHVRKNNIKSLDTTDPVTYKTGRLTDFQLLGETLMYSCAFFCGPFMFLTLPTDFISKPILPDE